MCRLPVHSAADIIDLKDFTLARQKRAEITEARNDDMKRLELKDSQHGSKLQQVAEVLRGILASKDQRAIVFCQFADLEMHISRALSDVGIAHARLSAAKDIFEQTAVIDSFQQKTGRHRVLLLSLEQSASGTNLTAASHVLLIHPMAASTAERALAFEQQAIGRCVRLGQKRPVTVWRFVTQGTVEELLDQRFSDQRRSHKSGPRSTVSANPYESRSGLPSDQRSAAAGTPREAVLALRRDEPGSCGSRAPRAVARNSSRPSRASSGRSGSMPRRSRTADALPDPA